jgi:hypothetical protein
MNAVSAGTVTITSTYPAMPAYAPEAGGMFTVGAGAFDSPL